MPEGPEVRIIAEQLDKILRGKIITKIRVKPVFVRNSEQKKRLVAWRGHRVSKVSCKGKFIYITLNDSLYLVSRLGMTGHWREDKTQHTLVELQFGSDEKLYYDDFRRFGSFAIFSKEELDAKLEELGPDVLSSGFTFAIFRRRLLGRHRSIVSLLSDQNIISGIGNYLRSDILYKARIAPLSLTSAILRRPVILRKLYRAIISVTRRSYKDHGTTIKTYRDIYMNPGYYRPLIYGRKTVGAYQVKKIRIQNRTVYWIPELQKILR